MLYLWDFEEILKRCEFNDWKIKVHPDNGWYYLQVHAVGKCNVSGEPWEWSGRKWRLSQHMTPSEVVQTAFKAVLTAVEHETREQFKYRGVSIFDPHYNVDKLVELRKEEDCLDERQYI